MTQLNNIQAITKDAEDKMKKAVEATVREFGMVRTGRASTTLVEGIVVEYYGAPTPLKQLATIATPDPKLITIQPWDPSALAEIEKAIMKSDLGITPMNDGKIVRLSIPALTTERRAELTKVVKKMAEDGRVSMRTIRRDANEHIKRLEKDKLATEDEVFKSTENIQKLTDKHIEKIEEILKAKEKELAEV